MNLEEDKQKGTVCYCCISPGNVVKMGGDSQTPFYKISVLQMLFMLLFIIFPSCWEIVLRGRKKHISWKEVFLKNISIFLFCKIRNGVLSLSVCISKNVFMNTFNPNYLRSLNYVWMLHCVSFLSLGQNSISAELLSFFSSCIRYEYMPIWCLHVKWCCQ